MEVRRALDELEIANDINLMSKEEFERKYFVSEEKYNYFMETYSNYFLNHLIYPLRVTEEFSKIAGIINDGNALYPSDNNLAYQEQIMEEMVGLSKRYNIPKDALCDESIESQYLFLDIIGDYKSKSNHNYREAVSKILEAGRKYENKGIYPVNDFESYVKCKFATSRSQAEANYAIDGYIQEHPLIQACNNKEYLYFVNYMMSYHKREVDNEFIEDAKGVIAASPVLERLGITRPGFDKKEYAKVAKHTLKNIKKFEDYKNKKENCETKKKIK